MYNILICDDERDIVSALKIYLSGEGFDLFEAYDGREALEIVRSRDIHLILMDIRQTAQERAAQDGADHQCVTRHQDAADVHHQLCRAPAA